MPSNFNSRPFVYNCRFKQFTIKVDVDRRRRRWFGDDKNALVNFSRSFNDAEANGRRSVVAQKRRASHEQSSVKNETRKTWRNVNSKMISLQPKIIFFQILVSFVSGKSLLPFSPSHQISESDFRPLNFNFDFHFNGAPIRRQFVESATVDTDNNSFEELSNPFEVGHQEAVAAPIPGRTIPESLKLSNPFEFAFKKDQISSSPLAPPPTGESFWKFNFKKFQHKMRFVH